MNEIRQGDILRLENSRFDVLTLSKDFFNRSGMIIACPVVGKADPDALHIEVTAGAYKGTALLEQIRSLDMLIRHYQRIGTLEYAQIQNIADAVQSIFDYYPFA